MLTNLDLTPFPARAAGDVIRAYQPLDVALIQLSSGRVHRIDVVQVFADGAIVVETVRQRQGGGGDYLRGGGMRWALHTLERFMATQDAQVLRDAITAAELDRAMREQMATDPEVGGPRDPELPPVQRHAPEPEQVRATVAERAPHMPQLDAASAEAAGPAYAARERSGASVEEVGGRMVFTLTQHGLHQLAEHLGTTAEHFAEVARRSGWQVEES